MRDKLKAMKSLIKEAVKDGTFTMDLLDDLEDIEAMYKKGS